MVVYNPRATRCKDVDPVAQGKRYLGEPFDVICIEQLPCRLPEGRVLVLGGDGTLQAVLAWGYRRAVDILYLALGNLNERAGQEPDGYPVVGVTGSGVFSYVLASGIFCPLGWMASTTDKQRWGKWAYWKEVLGQYRVPSIPARIQADGSLYRGRYALIMLVRSRACFGLPFNRAFAPDRAGGHLLLIPTVGEDTFVNRVRLFFPLFRVFFVGLKRDCRKAGYVWQAVDSVAVQTPTGDWCADGERRCMGTFEAHWERAQAHLTVLKQTRISAIDNLKRKKV